MGSFLNIIQVTINMHANIVFILPMFLFDSMSPSPFLSSLSEVGNDFDETLLDDAIILTSSDGVAAEYQGSKFGLYIRNGMANDAPLYQQMDSEEPSSYIFKYDNIWVVGPDPSNNKGWLRNQDSSDSVPSLQWEYFFTTEWHQDSGIKAAKVDASEICETVNISGDDEANRLASEYLGKFDAVKGKYSAGRMVYQNKESGKSLEVRPGLVNWLILDEKPGVITSGNGANSMNPADPVAAKSIHRAPNRKSWGYGVGNNEYRTNLNLTFECLP